MNYRPTTLRAKLLDYSIITAGSLVIGLSFLYPLNKFLTWVMNNHEPAPNPYLT